MKIGAVNKSIFWARYKNIPIETKDIIEFMKEHNLLYFDEEKARNQYETRMANKFIASFKDSDGAREFYAYTQNGKRKFRLIMNTKSTKVLYGQRRTLETQVDGLNKGIKKIDDRIDAVERQQSLFSEDEVAATFDGEGPLL